MPWAKNRECTKEIQRWKWVCPSGNVKEDFMEEAMRVFGLGLEWVGFAHEEMGRERQSERIT